MVQLAAQCITDSSLTKLRASPYIKVLFVLILTGALVTSYCPANMEDLRRNLQAVCGDMIDALRRISSNVVTADTRTTTAANPGASSSSLGSQYRNEPTATPATSLSMRCSSRDLRPPQRTYARPQSEVS